ncbi:MAG: hypothetical protein R3F65_17690 [bacterium]
MLDAQRWRGLPAEQRVGFWQAIGPHNRLVAGPTALDRWVHIPAGCFGGAAEGDGSAYHDEQPGRLGRLSVMPSAAGRCW